eukprot:c15485_g1_i2.p1 GENE.c15485_g1_i2~~c15485_g1_i2.p1  ORF type:complete len:303 (-),score=69.88 c15485_g1_i2:43-951(-)
MARFVRQNYVKALYRKLHPDLFHTDATKRSTNEKGWQNLNHLIECSASLARHQPINLPLGDMPLKFFVLRKDIDEQEEDPICVNINIPKALGKRDGSSFAKFSPAAHMNVIINTAIIQLCDLAEIPVDALDRQSVMSSPDAPHQPRGGLTSQLGAPIPLTLRQELLRELREDSVRGVTYETKPPDESTGHTHQPSEARRIKERAAWVIQTLKSDHKLIMHPSLRPHEIEFASQNLARYILEMLKMPPKQWLNLTLIVGKTYDATHVADGFLSVPYNFDPKKFAALLEQNHGLIMESSTRSWE